MGEWTLARGYLKVESGSGRLLEVAAHEWSLEGISHFEKAVAKKRWSQIEVRLYK